MNLESLQGGSSPTIAVAMSGGVDSSTVAAMLHDRGFDVVGLTMQLWNQRRLAKSSTGGDQKSRGCCSLEDVYDARRVAEQLGIPYYVVNYEERFERDVVHVFVNQYLSGRTPIPCSLCNTFVKFDELVTTARQIGAEKVATGHYARVLYNDETERYELWRGRDESKDQTFFLWGLDQEQLGYALFPLGEMNKTEVRRTASDLGLPVASKAESFEICFVPGNDYGAFISAYSNEQGHPLPDTSGNIVTSDGRILGVHAGIHRFTIGQRKGLGLADLGLEETAEALYVLRIDAANRDVIVGREKELLGSALSASGCHWISGLPPDGPLRVEARIRNRHMPAPAWAESLPQGQVRIIFDEPQRAITPGQSVVLYQGDLVLGGAWIDSSN